MRIDCPSCAAAYDVPAGVLTARRVMRCARCSTEFTPEAPSPAAPAHVATSDSSLAAPSLLVPPETVVAPDDRLGLSVLPQERAAPPPRAAILTAWLLSIVLLGAGGWAMIAWRVPIMRAWPASARLYVALGYAR